MALQHQSVSTILRRIQVQIESGYSRSTIYLRILQGLFPKPVRLGPRSVGWPAREIAAINEARIAGGSDAELRELVKKLMRARRQMARQCLTPHRVDTRKQAETAGRADRDPGIKADRSVG